MRKQILNSKKVDNRGSRRGNFPFDFTKADELFITNDKRNTAITNYRKKSLMLFTKVYWKIKRSGVTI
jgi:hypothetical protein